MNHLRRQLLTTFALSLTAAVANAATLGNPGMAVTTVIRIGGSGNGLGTMRKLGEAFHQIKPNISVQIVPQIGSNLARKAVQDGALDIGIICQPPAAEESRHLNFFRYGQAPVVFTVPLSNPLQNITRAQIIDIYAGRMNTWPNGHPIRPVLRPPTDSNTQLVKAFDAHLAQAMKDAESRLGTPVALTDQKAADKLEHITGSLGITSLSLILSERRALHPLSLDGIDPTPSQLALGRYPWGRDFYMVVSHKPHAAVIAFVNFVLSPAGRKILQQYGHAVP